MSSGRVMEKVTVFITRTRAGEHELLVFRHPNAGIQLPAGTVELGETVDAAAAREAREETGLEDLRMEQRLGVLDEGLNGNLRYVLRMTKLFDRPSFDASSDGHAILRGMPVRAFGEEGPFTLVDVTDSGQSTALEAGAASVTGYVRTSLLAKRLRRHLFHFLTAAETSPSWEVSVDGHVFHCYWTPLFPPPELHPLQAPWLDAALPTLRNWALEHPN